MSKKDGGTIKNWQIHTLSFSQEQIDAAHGVGFLPSVMTGTVVEDPTGRWQPGFHMRSSLIRSIDYENGIVETKNTIYHIEGEEGDPTLGNEDVGNFALKIFY